MLDDLEVQFADRRAKVPASVAYRMSRFNPQDFVIEDKRVPYNPGSWKRDRRLIWNCNVSSANGYGMVAENTIRALLQLGVNVECPGTVSASITSGGEYVNEAVLSALKTSIEPDAIEIQHCQPPSFRDSVVQRSWIYSMFETTHTPKSWIEILNKAEEILVPSSWLVESWKEQGVKRPIHVYGHGVDPEVFFPLERPDRETYTFLHYGRLSLRKGTDLVYRAFVEEFSHGEDVRLVLKDTVPFCPVLIEDPRVKWIHATYSKEQMRELMREADCFVFPTRGEGFGLPPLEAMATGLPTIVTNWSGPVDYADPADTLLLPYRLDRAFEFETIYQEFLAPGEKTGEWAEPDF